MRVESRRWMTVAGMLAASLLGTGAVAQLTLPKQGETLPSFEVATVKAPPESNSMFVRFMPDGYATQNIELRMVIRNAFGATSDEQVVGAPDALLSKHFDINAKVDAELAASLKKMPREDRNRQMQLLLQALLADRFHLQYHIETKEMPIYALVVARGGLKMKESAPPPPAPSDADGYHPPDPVPPSPNQPLPKHVSPGNMMMRMSSTTAELTASEGTIDGLTRILANQSDAGGRQIVDKTGLSGKYDYHLEWTPAGTGMAMKGADNGTAESGANPDAPGLFTAIEEQLGLKIEPDKGPVQVIVIDHLEAPTAN